MAVDKGSFLSERVLNTGVFVERSSSIVCTFDVSTSGWNTSNEVDVPQVNGLNVIGFTVYARSSYKVYSVMPSYNSSTHKVQCGGYISGTGTYTVTLYPLYAK